MIVCEEVRSRLVPGMRHYEGWCLRLRPPFGSYASNQSAASPVIGPNEDRDAPGLASMGRGSIEDDRSFEAMQAVFALVNGIRSVEWECSPSS